MAEDRLEHGAHLESLAVDLNQPGLGARVGRLRDEVAPQLPDEERCMLRVLDTERDRVAPRIGALFAEHRLRGGVVTLLIEAEVGLALAPLPRARPAGQSSGLLADIALGVAVALAEREELHQLPAVVLVRRVLAVVGPRQPDEHGGVRGDRDEQAVEATEGVAAQKSVLGEHQLLRADACVRRGEPVVPDECHALHERTAGSDHPVEPPELIMPPGVRWREWTPLVVAWPGTDPAFAGWVRE